MEGRGGRFYAGFRAAQRKSAATRQGGNWEDEEETPPRPPTRARTEEQFAVPAAPPQRRQVSPVTQRLRTLPASQKRVVAPHPLTRRRSLPTPAAAPLRRRPRPSPPLSPSPSEAEESTRPTRKQAQRLQQEEEDDIIAQLLAEEEEREQQEARAQEDAEVAAILGNRSDQEEEDLARALEQQELLREQIEATERVYPTVDPTTGELYLEVPEESSPEQLADYERRLRIHNELVELPEPVRRSILNRLLFNEPFDETGVDIGKLTEENLQRLEEITREELQKKEERRREYEAILARRLAKEAAARERRAKRAAEAPPRKAKQAVSERGKKATGAAPRKQRPITLPPRRQPAPRLSQEELEQVARQTRQNTTEALQKLGQELRRMSGRVVTGEYREIPDVNREQYSLKNIPMERIPSEEEEEESSSTVSSEGAQVSSSSGDMERSIAFCNNYDSKRPVNLVEARAFLKHLESLGIVDTDRAMHYKISHVCQLFRDWLKRRK